MGKALTERQADVLYGVLRQNMRYTSDIAHWLHEETHWIASPLKALERKGMIRCAARGGQGTPSIWEITPAGRAALGAKP